MMNEFLSDKVPTKMRIAKPEASTLSQQQARTMFYYIHYMNPFKFGYVLGPVEEDPALK